MRKQNLPISIDKPPTTCMWDVKVSGHVTAGGGIPIPDVINKWLPVLKKQPMNAALGRCN